MYAFFNQNSSDQILWEQNVTSCWGLYAYPSTTSSPMVSKVCIIHTQGQQSILIKLSFASYVYCINIWLVLFQKYQTRLSSWLMMKIIVSMLFNVQMTHLSILSSLWLVTIYRYTIPLYSVQSLGYHYCMWDTFQLVTIDYYSLFMNYMATI